MILIRENVERIASNAAQAEKLMAQGYVMLQGDDPAAPADKKPSGSPETRDISKMSINSLRALAKEKGLEGANALKKDELLEILKDVI